jgi:hypothetical protein
MITYFFIKCMPAGLALYGFTYRISYTVVIRSLSQHAAQVKPCCMVQAQLQLSSAVSRILLQDSQNSWLTALIYPTDPLKPGYFT